MTPKKRAIELVDRMQKDFEYFASKEVAKQHALIAVDEIIDILSKDVNPLFNYWFEVKQEIEKL
jgi:hypothetical protein